MLCVQVGVHMHTHFPDLASISLWEKKTTKQTNRNHHCLLFISTTKKETWRKRCSGHYSTSDLLCFKQSKGLTRVPICMFSLFPKPVITCLGIHLPTLLSLQSQNLDHTLNWCNCHAYPWACSCFCQ